MMHPGKRYPINSPEGKAITVILVLIGLFICLLGYPGTKQYHQIEDELVEVPATVTKATGGREHRKVFVTYTYEGTVYENVKVNATSSNMVEGAQITVPIHPDDPGTLKYNTTGPILGFGIICTGFSLTGLIAAFRPRKPEIKSVPKPDQPKQRKKKNRKYRRR